VEGPKIRARSETFADHYSQARQFYVSQTEIEQKHIGNALTFELSKVLTLAIRERMVSHLLNIDVGLAEAGVAPGQVVQRGHSIIIASGPEIIPPCAFDHTRWSSCDRTCARCANQNPE
jgi:hypothetical protein